MYFLTSEKHRLQVKNAKNKKDEKKKNISGTICK